MLGQGCLFIGIAFVVSALGMALMFPKESPEVWLLGALVVTVAAAWVGIRSSGSAPGGL